MQVDDEFYHTHANVSVDKIVYVNAFRWQDTPYEIPIDTGC